MLRSTYNSILHVVFLTPSLGSSIFYIAFLLFNLWQPAFAANSAIKPSQTKSTQHVVEVTLFGQPCTLSGPYSKQILQGIHKISPEQNPDIFESLSKTKTLIENIKKTSDTPKEFESYKEKLLHYFNSRIVFIEALEQSFKDKKFEAFYRKISDFLSMRNPDELRRNIETQWKIWTSKQKLDYDIALENYRQWSTPHPEEIFHRIIKNLSISYSCAFDERNDEKEEELEIQTPEPKRGN